MARKQMTSETLYLIINRDRDEWRRGTHQEILDWILENAYERDDLVIFEAKEVDFDIRIELDIIEE